MGTSIVFIKDVFVKDLAVVTPEHLAHEILHVARLTDRNIISRLFGCQNVDLHNTLAIDAEFRSACL